MLTVGRVAGAMLVAAAAIGAAMLLRGSPPPAAAPAPHWGKPDIIYAPTPDEVIDAMFAMAGLKDGDVIYDLGSGDGRILIAAAHRFDVRAVGIEIDPRLIVQARANAKAAGVADKVSFRQENIFTAAFHDATVITLYLIESLNKRLLPRFLAELKPGTRIVSHSFRMGDWQPERAEMVKGRMVYLWTVPPRS